MVNISTQASLRQMLILRDSLDYEKARLHGVAGIDITTRDRIDSDGFTVTITALLSEINKDINQRNKIKTLFGLSGDSTGNITAREFSEKVLELKSSLRDVASTIKKINSSSLPDPIKKSLIKLILLRDSLDYEKARLQGVAGIDTTTRDRIDSDGFTVTITALLSEINMDTTQRNEIKTLFGLSGDSTGNITAREFGEKVLTLKSSDLDLQLVDCVLTAGVATREDFQPTCLGDKFGRFTSGEKTVDFGASSAVFVSEELADSYDLKGVDFTFAGTNIAFDLSEEFASIPESGRGDITFEYSNDGGTYWAAITDGKNLVDTSSAGSKTLMIRAKWNGWNIAQSENLIFNVQTSAPVGAPEPVASIADPGNLGTDIAGTSLLLSPYETERLALPYRATDQYWRLAHDIGRGDTVLGTGGRLDYGYLSAKDGETYYLPEMKGGGLDYEVRGMLTYPLAKKAWKTLKDTRDGQAVDPNGITALSIGGYTEGTNRAGTSQSASGVMGRVYSLGRLGRNGQYDLLHTLMLDYGRRKYATTSPSAYLPNGELTRFEFLANTGWDRANFGFRYISENGDEATTLTGIANPDVETDVAGLAYANPVMRKFVMGTAAFDSRVFGSWWERHIPITLDAQIGQKTESTSGVNSFGLAGATEGSGGAGRYSGAWDETSKSFLFSAALEARWKTGGKWPLFHDIGVGVVGFRESSDRTLKKYSRLSSSFGAYAELGELFRLSATHSYAAGNPGGYLPTKKDLDVSLRARVPILPKLAWNKHGIAPRAEFGISRLSSSTGALTDAAISERSRSGKQYSGALIFDIDRPGRADEAKKKD